MRSISLFLRSVVKPLMLAIALTVAGTSASLAQDAAAGRALFKQKCTACHALDKDVVGPALKGVADRHSEEWLNKWIVNSQKMIDAGDPAAVALKAKWKAAMTPFPEITPKDVKDILAYTTAGEPAPKAEAGSGKAAEGISNLSLIGLALVIIIAILVVILLGRIVKSLERVLLKKQGLITDEEIAYEAAQPSAFKKLLKNKKFIFFSILMIVAILGTVGWNGMWNTGVHTGYQPVQPIKFSHELHAGINKIDCQYCHSGAYKSKNASIPSLNVCMNCHNYVTASEKYDGQTSPEIQKIYHALDYNPTTKQYGKDVKPIQWVRIHNLPDFAYFNHSQHVKVAGVACQKCHGPIQTMEEVYQYSPLTMKWCINCHRETEVKYQDNDYYNKVVAAHEKVKKGEKITAAVLGGLECGKCHY